MTPAKHSRYTVFNILVLYLEQLVQITNILPLVYSDRCFKITHEIQCISACISIFLPMHVYFQLIVSNLSNDFKMTVTYLLRRQTA